MKKNMGVTGSVKSVEEGDGGRRELRIYGLLPGVWNSAVGVLARLWLVAIVVVPILLGWAIWKFIILGGV